VLVAAKDDVSMSNVSGRQEQACGFRVQVEFRETTLCAGGG
jgi:hypothetical protein